ncbi:hypothetical protein TIFTF001_018233 [Ficus carica]|uniref:Uncharacterized protein n=1 Tax=Ficus carica TaxID=3494 RepID=A0AA88AVA9_FICCA|nr:hypothetical protein TIFTF001_018233 [Ficus carica]
MKHSHCCGSIHACQLGRQIHCQPRPVIPAQTAAQARAQPAASSSCSLHVRHLRPANLQPAQFQPLIPAHASQARQSSPRDPSPRDFWAALLRPAIPARENLGPNSQPAPAQAI